MNDIITEKQSKLNQAIIKQQKKLKTLKNKAKQIDTKKKIIIADLVLSIAKQNSNTANWLLNQITKIKNKKDYELVNSLIKKINQKHEEKLTN